MNDIMPTHHTPLDTPVVPDLEALVPPVSPPVVTPLLPEGDGAEGKPDFTSLGLPDFLIERLGFLSLTHPTPIQMKALPQAIEGRDILASSQTGSGKTLAYLIPLILHVMDHPQKRALVLLPTREIAIQVRDRLVQLLGRKSPLDVLLLIGGEPLTKQCIHLRKNPQIVIGTPGRICDHLDRKTLRLQPYSFWVLDEVDRMLDLGFTKPLQIISEELPPERQTLMFSATLPKLIEELSKKYLNNPARIAIHSPSKPASAIHQEIMHIAAHEKFNHVLKALEGREGSALIFVNTKRGADDLAMKLQNENHLAEAIHGGLQQRTRERVMKNFRKDSGRIMVATDVAARGLDIPHLSLVINYDMPLCPEDYVHRIGRTGRAGLSGKSLSLIAPHDTPQWKAIHRFMNPEAFADSKAPPPHTFRKGRTAGAFGKPMGGKPSLGKPPFGKPGLGKPSFGKPSLGKPGFEKPGFAKPGFAKPGFARKPKPEGEGFSPEFRKERPQAERPQEARPQEARPQGDRPKIAYSKTDYPKTDRAPGGKKSYGPHAKADRPQGSQDPGARKKVWASAGDKPLKRA